MPYISTEELTGTIEQILRRAGFSALHAEAVAQTVSRGERDGPKAHGIYRLDGILQTLLAGKVAPDAVPRIQDDGSAVIRVLAGGGFSPAAFQTGLPLLAERARTLGLAALIINDCVHFSALWPEIEALTDRGFAALAMCPSYAAVAPAGGSLPLLGTNPIAFGWPRRDAPPYVFDFATSVIARGEIELMRRDDKRLPDGWALDAEGHPTNHPEAALAGAMLPFGAHKGSAISTMIELLAGTMIGDLTSRAALDALGTNTLLPRHGELILAFAPDSFAAGRSDPFAQAEILFDAIIGQGARLPGQSRYARRAQATAQGIELSSSEMTHLQQLLG